MFKKIILCVLLINPLSLSAEELIINNDYQIVNSNEAVQSSNSDSVQEKIELEHQGYYYNEPEDDNSKEYIKTKYDFNIGESEMSVGIKGFSIKFPVSRR